MKVESEDFSVACQIDKMAKLITSFYNDYLKVLENSIINFIKNVFPQYSTYITDNQLKIFLAVSSVLFALLIICLKKLRNDPLFNVPGPRQWPFFGNVFTDAKLPTHLRLSKWGEKYEGIFKIRFFTKEYVIVTSYDDIYEVLVTKSTEFAGRDETFRLKVRTFSY